jgi:AraC-like DNA-binding protein
MLADYILYGGAFLSFIFTVHLFTYNVGNILLNRLLGLLFFVRALNSCILMVNSIDSFDDKIRISVLIQGLLFLAPATLFLYIRAYLFDASRLKKRDLLHLLPFAVLLVFSYLLFTNFNISPSNQLLYEQQMTMVFMVLRAFLHSIYLVFSWQLLFKVVRNDAHKVNKISVKWLFLMLGLITFSQVFQLFFSTLYLLDFITLPNQFNSTPFFVISGLASTFFIIFILRNPKVLYGNLIPRHRIEPNNSLKVLTETPDRQSDTANQSGELLETEQIGGYLQMIENHMKEAQPFLDSTFTIGQLSAKLEIPVHHCSFVLNQGLGKNFREYINNYRVDYFIKEYPIKITSQTMESIALISGFKSSSTFYTSFKKETGTSPTVYFS